jgi:hypothetical protein
MARTASTGVIELRYVPTIANKAAPTVAELTTGAVDLTPWLTRDGLDTPQGGSTVDVAGANSRYNATQSGSYGGDPISATFFRDTVSGSDTAWTTLARGTAGYFVIGRFGLTPTAGERVEVWEINVISRAMVAIADNEAQRFVASMAVPSEPNDAAVVAA